MRCGTEGDQENETAVDAECTRQQLVYLLAPRHSRQEGRPRADPVVQSAGNAAAESALTKKLIDDSYARTDRKRIKPGAPAPHAGGDRTAAITISFVSA